jgi:hypothetical protein
MPVRSTWLCTVSALPLPVPARLAAPSVHPHEPELEYTPSPARAPCTRWLLEPPTNELLRHRRRPHHPERATPSRRSLSSNAAPPSPVQAASTPHPRATAKAKRLSAVTKLPPPCMKGFAPPAPSLPCRCPCSHVFPPLAVCKVFEAMPEP